MRNSKRYTVEYKDVIVDLYELGMSLSEISREYRRKKTFEMMKMGKYRSFN